jgi:hypothetical protein
VEHWIMRLLLNQWTCPSPVQRQRTKRKTSATQAAEVKGCVWTD